MRRTTPIILPVTAWSTLHSRTYAHGTPGDQQHERVHLIPRSPLPRSIWPYPSRCLRAAASSRCSSWPPCCMALAPSSAACDAIYPYHAPCVPGPCLIISCHHQRTRHASTLASMASIAHPGIHSILVLKAAQCLVRIGPVFGFQIPNSKFFFRHLHGDLNLDEIKNALRLLSVNGETNLMNLTKL